MANSQIGQTFKLVMNKRQFGATADASEIFRIFKASYHLDKLVEARLLPEERAASIREMISSNDEGNLVIVEAFLESMGGLHPPGQIMQRIQSLARGEDLPYEWIEG